MTLALALSPAPVDAPRFADKPGWWLTAVERATRTHREARAASLLESGAARLEQAWSIRHALIEGKRDELGTFVGRAHPMRALPGGTPEVLTVIRHWDRELYTSSRGKRRLLRGEHETTDEWQARILAECDRRIDSVWHKARANGQRERFRKVENCGADVRGVLVCDHCKRPALNRNGFPLVLRDLCDSHLLCGRCRKKRSSKYRAKILRSRHAALEAVRQRNAHRGYDSIRERFLTLTCPTVPAELGGPEAQARILRDAWTRFMNALRGHWKRHRAFKLCRFVRVLEATAGSHDQGHVHAHAWILGPFVRVHVIRALWGRALLAAGFPREAWPAHAWKLKAEILAELEAAEDARALEWARHTLSQKTAWPIVDVQQTRGDGSEQVHELVKYLLKDIASVSADGTVVHLHPELFAAIYRGLDAGRLLTASLGFWVRYHAVCACCGAVDTLRPVELARPPADARAPPLLELVS